MSHKDHLFFKVPGEPIPLPRPRYYNGHTISIPNDHPGLVYKHAIMRAASMAVSCGEYRIDKRPCRVCVHAHFAIPSSWPNWKKEAAQQKQIAHTGRPDADNIVKMILDSLNRIAWPDDSFVYCIDCIKLYDRRPTITVAVSKGAVGCTQTTSLKQFKYYLLGGKKDD